MQEKNAWQHQKLSFMSFLVPLIILFNIPKVFMSGESGTRHDGFPIRQERQGGELFCVK